MKLFGQHIHAPILLLAAAEYGVAAIAFAVAVSLLVGGGLQLADAEGRVIPWVFAFSTAVVVGLTAFGLYQPKQRLRPEGVALRLIAALVFAVVCLSLVSLYYPIGRDGPVLLVSSTLSLGLLGVSRIVFAKFIDHEAFRRRVLVYGAGDRAASLLKLRRRSDQRAFKIVAFVPAPGDRSRLQDERVVSTPLNLVRYAHDHDIDEIVVAMDERRETLPIRELLECRFSGIDVIDLLGFFERETGKIKVDLMNPAWLIFSEGFSIKPSQRVASRILDLVIAALLAVLSLPVVVLVAAAIFLEDGAPVLYRQKRVGYGGKTFELYKFRSMVKDAESDGRPKWAGRDDPRVTKVGRFIRKTRLDELPQLFNVIRGDMSLVGPRPERPEFVEDLSRKIPYYHERHSVKPGVTGWAQLCYPYGSSDDDAMEKLQYDLYYVKHKSVVFDLMVILQTVEVVLWGKGAR